MKPTKRQKLAGQAIQKCRNGQSITDAELKAGISVLEEVVPALLAMGDSYYLAQASLQCRLTQLESFQQARKQK